jgi:hypothetical protein
LSAAYSHGSTECRACFTNGNRTIALGDWWLHNNLGYYGASTPEILVLGFSKGANQNKAAEEVNFDKVAFAKARSRLQQVLETLGVMPRDRSIDSLMTARERQFGVASLVRCSFYKMKERKCKTSGDIIPSAFSNSQTRSIIERCASTFLGLPHNSVRLVVLLGTSDTYIEKTKMIFSRMYRDYADVNGVAFRASNALWIYATHPSPGNGHFDAWVSGATPNSSAQKKELVLTALRMSNNGFQPTQNPSGVLRG